MAPAQETVDRYARQASALLPPGRALSKRLDSAIRSVIEAASVPFARVHEDAAALKRELLPSQADALLSEWEDATGLPNCASSPSDLEGRQAALISHLVASGGQSEPDFQAIAAALGFEIELVREYEPMTCVSPCTSHVASIDWVWHRLVSVVGDSNDALRDLLICRFSQHGHIHTMFAWTTYLMIDGEFLLVDGEPLMIDG